MAALAGFGLLVAACGSDSKSSSSTSSAATTTSSAGASPTTGAPDTTAGSDTTTDSSGSSESSSSESSSSESSSSESSSSVSLPSSTATTEPCSPATDTPYKIGALIDETGALSALSTEVEKGLVARVADVNACGGVDGHPLDLVIKDGQSDAAAAVAATRELASEGVLVIVGPLSGTTAAAVQPVVTAAKIPAITQQGGMILDNSSYMFGQNINPNTVIREYAEYLLSKGVHKLGALYASNALGQSQIELAKPIFTDVGLTLVDSQAVDPAGNDYTTQLASLKSAGAEAVYGFVSGTPAVVAAKGFKALQMSGFLLVQNLSVAQLELFGDSYDVAVAPQPKVSVYDQLSANDPYYELTQTYAAWATKNDVAIDLFGSDGYDAVDIIVDSIKKAGPDSEKIFALWNAGYERLGLSGPLKWSAEDHQGVGWGYAWTKIDPNGPNGARLVIIDE
jgi:branched-chain amino acid transport system substrate-binding protein